MEYREPPRIDAAKPLDFSEFHPLDHSAWSRECASQPGGRRRHVSLRWEYILKPAIRVRTVCRLSLHSRVQVTLLHHGEPYAVHTGCSDCGKRLSATQPL